MNVNLRPGRGKAKSTVAHFQRLLKKVFKEAEIVGGHSHRFRDTFAVELLLAGVEIRKVSKALGHDSVATIEKYYGAWCKRYSVTFGCSHFYSSPDSSRELVATITATDIAQAGTALVFVFNPPEGGTTFVSGGIGLISTTSCSGKNSNAVSFTINR